MQPTSKPKARGSSNKRLNQSSSTTSSSKPSKPADEKMKEEIRDTTISWIVKSVTRSSDQHLLIT